MKKYSLAYCVYIYRLRRLRCRRNGCYVINSGILVEFCLFSVVIYYRVYCVMQTDVKRLSSTEAFKGHGARPVLNSASRLLFIYLELRFENKKVNIKQ